MLLLSISRHTPGKKWRSNMRNYTTKQLTNMGVFFLHIPKTAGTSIIQFLSDRFDLDAIMPSGLAHRPGEYTDDINPVLLTYRHTYELVAGHFDYDIYRQHFSDHMLVTFLRDPKRRVISLYNDFRTKSDENLATAHEE